MKVAIAVAVLLMFSIAAQTQSSRKKPMPLSATGTFEVKIAPLSAYNQDDKTLGRFSIDKQFHGALEGTSKGEMLSAGSASASGGYVAIEKVTGKLNGQAGSFVLQHSATMENGKPHLSITVVPGSGTGELTGLTGRMNIVIESGKHSYTFEYTL